MNYRDIPPEAQAAMLRQVGLPDTGTEEVNAANVAAAKAKQAAKQNKRPLA
jgi:hypothetical protein